MLSRAVAQLALPLYTVYANSIAGFPEYTRTVRVREEGAQIKIEEFYLPGY